MPSGLQWLEPDGPTASPETLRSSCQSVDAKGLVFKAIGEKLKNKPAFVKMGSKIKN
jgi:hypothetical protein